MLANYLKFILIFNYIIVGVICQDMPPPILEPYSTTTSTTARPTFPVFSTTTTATESSSTSTTASTSTSTSTTTTTTTKKPSVTINTTIKPISTTTTTRTTTTTEEPITTTAVNEPVYSPSYTITEGPSTNPVSSPFDPDQRNCYFKTHYDYRKLQWTCYGYRLVHPIQCYRCCYYGYQTFAACESVHDFYCIRNNRKDYQYNINRNNN